jgi:hypothetical protein
LTLQYDDIIKKCTPDPLRSRPCDFYIAVYGWKNSTYTIAAKVADGFASPTLLLDQVSHSGHVETGEYEYYRYYIQANETKFSIKFVVTPTGTLFPSHFLRGLLLIIISLFCRWRGRVCLFVIRQFFSSPQ